MWASLPHQHLRSGRAAVSAALRAGDESTAFANFKPAPNGTVGAYQFAPGQKYALYPQLADATPFVLSKADADAIAFNKDPSKGPVFKPAK